VGFVTPGQIERARQLPVLDYILTYEKGNFKPVGRGYRSKEHEYLTVSDKGFYWHSHGIRENGSRLSYLCSRLRSCRSGMYAFR
jgi:hypothetical protein